MNTEQKRYRVCKPRLVLDAKVYGQGAMITTVPSQLIRRAVRDGDLEEVTGVYQREHSEAG